MYEGRRSSTLYKIKTFYDAEAEVTGYEAGKGKHVGSTGALKCKMASGKVRVALLRVTLTFVGLLTLNVCCV